MKSHNKVVFITDAECDSGKTLINRLADEGAHLVLNSLNPFKGVKNDVKSRNV